MKNHIQNQYNKRKYDHIHRYDKKNHRIRTHGEQVINNQNNQIMKQ